MPEIRPFPAVRYPRSHAELAAALSPPYDVISPAYVEVLRGRDPHNVVRLVLNAEGSAAGYAEAGRLFREWQQQGILVQEPRPALYLLEQGFSVEGTRYTRRGLLARFRAEAADSAAVLPHEHTRRAPREDRFLMLKATRANFSPIFLMFPDTGGRFAAAAAATTAAAPLAEYRDDAEVDHRVWSIADERTIAALAGHLASVKTYIADGHHRYATAQRFRDEVGPDGAWTLGYFTPLEDPGLVVLPYHRIVTSGPALSVIQEKLGPAFDVARLDGPAALARAVGSSRAPYAFGIAAASGQGLLAESRPAAEQLLPPDAHAALRVLDTFFLHQAVLRPVLGIADEAIDYVHSLAEAEESLQDGRAALALLLRPTPVLQIVAVAEARQSMPAKSTFFHPKLPSGLVIHPLLA